MITLYIKLSFIRKTYRRVISGDEYSVNSFNNFNTIALLIFYIIYRLRNTIILILIETIHRKIVSNLTLRSTRLFAILFTITNTITVSSLFDENVKDNSTCPSPLSSLPVYLLNQKKKTQPLFYFYSNEDAYTSMAAVDNAQTIIVNWQIAAVKRAESGIVSVTARGKRRVNGKRRAINQRGNSS